MMKDIFRGVGIGCILAGGILYYTNSTTEQMDSKQYESQLEDLQTELDNVKKELAVAQMQSPSLEDVAENYNSNDGVGETEQESESINEEMPVTKIILTIEAGSTSSTVANKLERARIIGSANELEQFLIDNNLAGRIQIGEHEIDTSMDIGTIARIITNTKNR
ncbi:hypothetical protein [Sporosarcina sp. UB5]|uniref:hypothetical protein n=1 Tax=Sporosarcina sp. UB5 TaxID=3047463 RepID=UPI003D7993A0